MPGLDTDTRTRLTDAGLRPTRQRVLLCDWLYQGANKHFTAEDMYHDVREGDSSVSLATVYNTLSVFTKAGLIRTVSVDAGRVYYDTNIEPHFHIFDAEGNGLMDVDASGVEITGLPDLPEGQVVDQIELIIRTRKA